VEIVSLLGKQWDIEVECGALLKENKIYTDDFTEETMQYLKTFEAQLDE